MSITQRSREDYFYFSIYLLCFSIPFDNNLSNRFIGISVILWLYTLPKIEVKQKWNDYRYYIILFALPLFIHGVGLIHSDNFPVGIARFEARLAQLIFPVIILLSNLQKDQFRKAGYFLCFGVFVSSFICLGVNYGKFLETQGAWQYHFTYEVLLEPLNLHANFYPLFVCFATLFLIHEAAFEKHNTLVRILLAVSALYMIVLVVLIQSRAPMAALGLILFAGTIYYLISSSNTYRFTKLSIVTVFVILIGLLVSNKSFHGRFSFSVKNIEQNMFAKDADMNKEILSIIEHFRCWYCATDLLSDYHFFTGFGTGDERDVLTQCYQSNGWSNMVSSRFTSHNEYLSSLIRNGLVELLILIGIFLIPFIQSLKSNYILYSAFILLWILVLFFSSLHRQSLITFYALFNAMLFKVMIQREHTNTVKQTG